MKKLIAFTISAVLAVSVPVYADKTDDQIAKIEKQIEILQAQLDKLQKQKAESEGTQRTEVKEENEYSITDDGNTFTYIKTDVITENAKLYAVVYFSYTNKSGAEQTPGWNLNDKAFQNGTELEHGYIYRTDIPEHDLMYKEIMDGTTVTIASIYELTDMSDLTVKLEPLFSWDNSNTCKFTVSLIQQ